MSVVFSQFREQEPEASLDFLRHFQGLKNLLPSASTISNRSIGKIARLREVGSGLFMLQSTSIA
jgi:hypothetical protein